MDKIFLKTQGITKDYGEKIKNRVLFGIDLEIRAGEFTSLMGSSGSGKSTLLNILGALDRPSSGKVIFEDIDIGQLNDDELAYFRNRTIGFIFQFHYLLPRFSVLENILLPYMIYVGRVPPPVRQRALELLDRVGLADRRDYHAADISGGEQQRAAIARSLINMPRMILADEPTGNLDSSNTQAIFSLLRGINKDYRTTFIMVTHDLNLARNADRLLELKDGLIVKDIVFQANI